MCNPACWLGRVQSLNHPTAASGTPSQLYTKTKTTLITPVLSTDMADSFADLWNSSVPLKPSEPARKLGASPAPSSGAPRPKYDAFAILTASGSSSSSSRSLTPSSKPAVVAQRGLTVVRQRPPQETRSVIYFQGHLQVAPVVPSSL